MKNVSILLVVVIGIVLIEILTVVGMIILVVQERQIPGTLETIAVAGLTGLLGVLAPSRAAATPIEDVQGRHERPPVA